MLSAGERSSRDPSCPAGRAVHRRDALSGRPIATTKPMTAPASRPARMHSVRELVIEAVGGAAACNMEKDIEGRIPRLSTASCSISFTACSGSYSSGAVEHAQAAEPDGLAGGCSSHPAMYHLD